MDSSHSPDYASSGGTTPYTSLWLQLRKLFNLEVDNAKMLLTEKLTVLVARIALCAVVFVVGTCTLIFLSMAAADFLLESLPPRWTYLIVAGFYALLIVLMLCFRRAVFINPVARFMSRVILDPPASATGAGVADRSDVTDNSHAHEH